MIPSKKVMLLGSFYLFKKNILKFIRSPQNSVNYCQCLNPKETELLARLRFGFTFENTHLNKVLRHP